MPRARADTIDQRRRVERVGTGRSGQADDSGREAYLHARAHCPDHQERRKIVRVGGDQVAERAGQLHRGSLVEGALSMTTESLTANQGQPNCPIKHSDRIIGKVALRLFKTYRE